MNEDMFEGDKLSMGADDHVDIVQCLVLLNAGAPCEGARDRNRAGLSWIAQASKQASSVIVN